MRLLSVSIIAVAALGTLLTAGVSAFSQSSSAPHRKVFGYQDGQTGTFHPLSRSVPDASTTATTGTVEVTLTISLKTALPKGGAITCGAGLSEYTISSTDTYTSFYNEEAETLATVSGSTATCTVNIPYSWLVPASGSLESSFTGSYTVSMNSAAGTLPAVVRSSSGDFVAATTVPATGTTSKYSVAVTL